MSYRACTSRGTWIGIVETNYAWAEPYWRGRGYRLVLSPSQRTEYTIKTLWPRPIVGEGWYKDGEIWRKHE